MSETIFYDCMNIRRYIAHYKNIHWHTSVRSLKFKWSSSVIFSKRMFTWRVTCFLQVCGVGGSVVAIVKHSVLLRVRVETRWSSVFRNTNIWWRNTVIGTTNIQIIIYKQVSKNIRSHNTYSCYGVSWWWLVCFSTRCLINDLIATQARIWKIIRYLDLLSLLLIIRGQYLLRNRPRNVRCH